MIGVAVQLVPAPLLRGAPADVAQDRSRQLELVVAPLGEDLVAVPAQYVRHQHPQDPRPPRRQQRPLGPGHLAREDGELHTQRAGERVREGHPHDPGWCGPVRNRGQESSLHEGHTVHAAHLLRVGFEVEPLLSEGKGAEFGHGAYEAETQVGRRALHPNAPEKPVSPRWTGQDCRLPTGRTPRLRLLRARRGGREDTRRARRPDCGWPAHTGAGEELPGGGVAPADVTQRSPGRRGSHRAGGMPQPWLVRARRGGGGAT